MFAYRVGFPGWKIAAKLGLPLTINVSVMYDDECKVLVAECEDFLPNFGIVTEGATYDELQRKIGECCDMAMEEAFDTTDIHQTIRLKMTLVDNFS